MIIEMISLLLLSQVQEDWWSWIISTDIDLLRIEDGSQIMEHQPESNENENIIFLTGAPYLNITRNITTTSDKTIIMPVINFYRSCECSPISILFGLKETLLSARGGGVDDLLVNAELELNGKPLQYKRMTSDLFFLNNELAVADGYWMVLDGLDPGHHTLYTKASDKHEYHQEVTYNIVVVK